MDSANGELGLFSVQNLAWRHAKLPKVREARQNRASDARTLWNGLYDDIMMSYDRTGHREGFWDSLGHFVVGIGNFWSLEFFKRSRKSKFKK